MINKLSFACIAVNSLEEATKTYTKLFDLQVMQPPNDFTRFGFRSTYLGNGREALIEFLEPIDQDSAVAKFLKSRGEGIYLVTFEVDDLREAVREVRARGGRITGIPDGEDPEPNTEAVWVHPKDTHGAFIELLQKGLGPLPGS